jgi:2-polyprenyl-6-methoxyphenol hydroxylase-like FAD-dependent oxidoreductase
VFLGKLLARVVAEHEPDTLLDEYESVRRPVALGVVRMTDRMTRMATLRSGVARAARNTLMRLAGRVPAVRYQIAYRLAELAQNRSHGTAS